MKYASKINLIFLRRLTFLPVLLITLACSGCATMFCGDSQKVEFNSTPSGASVYDGHGNLLGKTPLKTKVLRECRTITFKKPGYESLSISSGRSFQIFPMILNALWWPTLIVDAYTGDCYGLKDSHNVQLEPIIKAK